MPAKSAAQKIRVAVVGAGNMGRNHIRTYKKLESVDLVGLADINPEAAKLAKEHGVKFYSDYQKMINEQNPQVISLVVPTPLHHKIGLDILSRGINCLIEKPIASSTKEADELIAAAKKSGSIFTVGHIEHYNPMILKLKKLIEAGKIGEITSIVCRRVGGFPFPEPKTDVIIDLAVHDIGIMSHLLGKKPKAVYSHGSKTLHSTKVDSASILLDYGESSGFVQANWLTPVKIRTIAVTGSKGYLEGNYITQTLVLYEHNMKRVKNGFENFVTQFGEPRQISVNVETAEPLAVELEAFISRVQGDKTPYLIDPKDARDALDLALKAIKHYK